MRLSDSTDSIVHVVARLFAVAVVGSIAAACASTSGGSSSSASSAGGLFGGDDPNKNVVTVASGDATTIEQYLQSGYCPPVEIRPGTETLIVYERGHDQDPAYIRFQGSITKTARECHTIGADTLTIKVGIAGRLTAGPKGGAGNFALPLRIAVIKQHGGNVFYSESPRCRCRSPRPTFAAGLHHRRRQHQLRGRSRRPRPDHLCRLRRGQKSRPPTDRPVFAAQAEPIDSPAPEPILSLPEQSRVPAARSQGRAATTAGRDRATLARRRRSNRPGNSQAKGPDGRRRSGKQRAATPCPLTEGVTARERFQEKCEALFRPEERPEKAREISQVLGQRGRGRTGVVRCREPVICRGLPLAEPAPETDLRETPLAAAPSRARRAHGAVRRLCDAGAVPDRHHRRAQMDARARRPLRRLAHGPVVPAAGATSPATPTPTTPRSPRSSSRWSPATSAA